MDLVHELTVARRRAVGTLDGAAIVLDTPANLQRRWEAVGGWLALSPDWLAFTPHRFNWRIGRLLIPTAAVRQVWPCWTWLFGLVPGWPNSIAIETTSGRVYRFMVADRHAWVAVLRCLIAVPGIPQDNRAD